MKWFIYLLFQLYFGDRCWIMLCYSTFRIHVVLFLVAMYERIQFNDLYICVGFTIIYPCIILIMMMRMMIMEGKRDEEVYWLM